MGSEEPGESVWFESGSGSVVLGFHVAEQGVGNPGAAVNVSFGVPDVDAERERPLGLGLKVSEAWDAPWGSRVAILQDPAGHIVWIGTPLAS